MFRKESNRPISFGLETVAKEKFDRLMGLLTCDLCSAKQLHEDGLHAFNFSYGDGTIKWSELSQSKGEIHFSWKRPPGTVRRVEIRRCRLTPKIRRLRGVDALIVGFNLDPPLFDGVFKDGLGEISHLSFPISGDDLDTANVSWLRELRGEQPREKFFLKIDPALGVTIDRRKESPERLYITIGGEEAECVVENVWNKDGKTFRLSEVGVCFELVSPLLTGDLTPFGEISMLGYSFPRDNEQLASQYAENLFLDPEVQRKAFLKDLNKALEGFGEFS